jgi:cyanophycinase
MSETMLAQGKSNQSYRIGELRMAPGLGFLPDAIIDQHLAERGRFGRLFGAVAHNPRVFGIGLDEDTALVAEGGSFKVIGSGCAYVVDGAGITHSNIAEAGPRRALSMYDLRLHVPCPGDTFDVCNRRPTRAPDIETSQRLEMKASDQP